MKRVLSVLLGLIMLFASVAAAETSIDLALMEQSELMTLYGDVLTEIGKRSIPTSNTGAVSESPILFRKINWGTSATDFLAIMKEQGVSGSVYDAYSCQSWEFKPDDGTIKCVDSLKDCGFKYSCSPKELSVGGFKVSSIEAYFIHGYDENDVYVTQQKSTLYRASYEFDVADGKAAYEVLCAKMISLYGEGQVGSNSTGWWSTGGDYHTYCDWTVWYGTENTGVVLYHVYETYDADSTVKNDKVHLLYGKTDSLTMLNGYKSAKAREELEEAMKSEDTDGL